MNSAKVNCITIKKDLSHPDAVRDSRAGDVFHYRWAARRCLRMLDMKSKVKHIVIEGSSEPSRPGEFVMDVTEHVESQEISKDDVNYFQLKHSIKRVDLPFQLSELKDTIAGFANRFKDHLDNSSDQLGTIKYYLITNRALNKNLTKSVRAIANGDKADKRIQNTLKKYTKLNDSDLVMFCSSLEFVDSELNFDDQKKELHFEMGSLFAGAVDQAEINNLISLIQERALPNTDIKNRILGKIVREDILRLFGVTSPSDLFPTPSELEKVRNLIKRTQHDQLLHDINCATDPIIIQAEGGVGKSIVCQQLANTLPTGSLTIIYDCFGAGNYLNKSQPRHRFRDGLLQISNEIALNGYCNSLILRQTDLDDYILRAFLSRIQSAAKKLKQQTPDAILAIFIDAADNAEMAAKEAASSCFVNAILRESYPENCRIIALCRPERTYLLNPKSSIRLLNLESFTETETFHHLSTVFQNVNAHDAAEFHGLTGGNPRVQANAMALNTKSVEQVLSSLGPGMTVDAQISQQLLNAISRLKEQYTQVVQSDIDSICFGLANFPPYIPIKILASASNVTESTIRSFVADLGRPLWLSENHIQFRDEPTETWFRENFPATDEQVSIYIDRIKPLALAFNYVAEVIPMLLHKAGQYDDLVQLALSEDLLPESPIDKRNVRINRLQFAFKAALKQKNYVDAAKLSLLAGEEMAGDKRQLELLSENIDLIAPLQSPQKVQELAFRRMLSGGWDGSENIYSASLLSTVEDFKGEARSYLRSADNWLKIYFEDRKKNKSSSSDEKLDDKDIAEMAFAALNLYGTEPLIRFINSWRPPELAFRITRLLTKRLVDIAAFEKINQFSLLASNNLYITLAINHELMILAESAPVSALQQTLELLGRARNRPKKSENSWKTTDLEIAIISFCEACASHSFNKRKVLKILDCYFSTRANNSTHGEHGQEIERDCFLRVAALRAILSENKSTTTPILDLNKLMPEAWLEDVSKHKHETSGDIKLFNEVIGALAPLHLLRTLLIVKSQLDLPALVVKADSQSNKARAGRYREYDRLPCELIALRFEVIKFYKVKDSNLVNEFANELESKNCKLSLDDSLNALRIASRVPHLTKLRSILERFCHQSIIANKSDGSEMLGDRYIQLARAVLSESVADSMVYFDSAIEAVSKFGDELVNRWEALTAVASRAAKTESVTPELSYKFIRCAELVGENVYREKHWSRDEAIEVCFQLNAPSAFAALSRWRDRDIGWFERQFSTLLTEATRSRKIPAKVGWSLSCMALTDFIREFNYLNFVILSIELEVDQNIRQYIFDKSIRDFRLSGGSKSDWDKLSELSTRFKLNNIALKEILATDIYSEEHISESDYSSTEPKYRTEYFNNWDKLFTGLSLNESESLNEAVRRFDNVKIARQPETFWAELFQRAPEANASAIIQKIIDLEHVDYFDITYALSAIPQCWREKVSVKKVWPKVIQQAGKRFATTYTNWYTTDHLFRAISANSEEKGYLNKGVLEGLENNSNLVDSSTLFGFCNVVTGHITPESAVEILGFGLDRFNVHIEDQFADGEWSELLNPPNNCSEAVAGTIWAALGSPSSKMRWKAAHTVRRLIETNCEAEIDELIQWLELDLTGAFGNPSYPFYNLHARLYLLIAIARSVKGFPEPFQKHSNVFLHHALNSIPHALIQKFAAEIALDIERAFPNTYSAENLKQLCNVGVSQFPILKLNGHHKTLHTPWHKDNQIDQNIDFNFSYDFDRYWFESLSNVFGVSSNQVVDIAKQIVVKDWNLKVNGHYLEDARLNLWKSDRDRETWHSHSEYPKTDNYQFYISYHAMLSAASKLLKEMPVVQRYDYEENQWLEWFQRHTLSSNKGYWLSDRRDAPPLKRRDWTNRSKSKTWRWEISSQDFLDGLFVSSKKGAWLNVWGNWTDADHDRVECYRVMSALVNPQTSFALLNALTTCSNPHDYKLPNYLESEMEFTKIPFTLEGWISRSDQSTYLDELDPFSGEIAFPPHALGKSYAEKFGITSDIEERKWCSISSKDLVMESEIWGTEKNKNKDLRVSNGNRINASFSFLKKICEELNRDLIIEVQIDRHDQYHSYQSESDDEIKYTPSYSKVYLFSRDGTLRDATASYRIGEGLSL
jgi:hypothetical protein